MKFNIGDEVVIDESASINRDGLGDRLVAQGLRGRVWIIVGFERDNVMLAGSHNQAGIGYSPHRFKLAYAAPTSNAFAWSGGIPQDPDLQRGYTEECSEYRACTNENGDWVIEARRVKIIAQCADEAEARRIADALNNTINN